MEKKALLVYGERNQVDNNSFETDRNRDIGIIKDIIQKEGYNYKVIPVSQLDLGLKEYTQTEDFLFYFNGHANSQFLGNFSTRLEDLVGSIEKLKGEKTIVLDACTLNFSDVYSPEKDTKLITSTKVYPSRSIAMSLYDLVIARNIPLKKINQKTFEEIKHYGVIVKGKLKDKGDIKNAN